MNNDLSLLLVSLRSSTFTQDEFISVETACDKIIADAETVHFLIVQGIFHDENPKKRIEFSKEFKIREEEIENYKLPDYNVPVMKKSLNDAINEGFKRIHDEWVKKSQPKK